MTTPRYGPIPLSVHAAADVVLLGLLAVSPWVLGYTQHTTATALAVGFAVAGMVQNFMTDYPVGLWRKPPMKWHRLAELACCSTRWRWWLSGSWSFARTPPWPMRRWWPSGSIQGLRQCPACAESGQPQARQRFRT